jgi:CHAT domain-containing protein
LQLDADLVTLSACETGLNRAMSGDDLIGMTRGFLYAGSSNIIASLWEVDDEATAELMVTFYEKLRAGPGKAQALQEAQQALWKKFPEPRYWAAFYLTGQGA